MSTKEWIYQSEDELCKFGIYQELTLEDDNNNPATISVKNPSDFSLDYYTNAKHKAIGELTAKIPAEQFDKIAIAWCKHRNLTGALGGPVGIEYGSQDCEYE
jgi:hypothetical protein